jgi:hypothetical protein
MFPGKVYNFPCDNRAANSCAIFSENSREEVCIFNADSAPRVVPRPIHCKLKPAVIIRLYLTPSRGFARAFRGKCDHRRKILAAVAGEYRFQAA